jgi:hypothetical protein
MLLATMNNADHAPWDDARWYQAAKEAVTSYTRDADPMNDPLFTEMLPQVLGDRGEQGPVDKAEAQKLFHELSDVWDNKAQKIGIRVWFHFVRAMKHYLQIWHSRLIVVLYMCLSRGLLQGPVHPLKVTIAANKAEDRNLSLKSSKSDVAVCKVGGF